MIKKSPKKQSDESKVTLMLTIDKEALGCLDVTNRNLRAMNDLLESTASLLSEVIKGSLKVVNTPLHRTKVVATHRKSGMTARRFDLHSRR